MIPADSRRRGLLASHGAHCACGLAGRCEHGRGFCPCQTAHLPRHRVMQPTRGLARYLVFVAAAGSDPVGQVEHTTTGLWAAVDGDYHWLGQAHRRRRDAVRDVLVAWAFADQTTRSTS